MATRTQLTENSWLIKNKTNMDLTGLLFKDGEDYLFLSKTKQMKLSEDQLKRLGKLKDVERDEQESIQSINGFQVKHEEIEIISEEPPIYRRKPGIVRFMAGYVGLKFDRGWTLAFCPKESTTQEYEIIGPFRNRLEALAQVQIMNTRNINDSI